MAFASGSIVLRIEPELPVAVTKKAFNEALRFVSEQMLSQAREITDKPYPPASQPFNPPHKRTGRHQAGLGVTGTSRSAISFRVNTKGDAPHSNLLQTGTSNMLPRLTWEHVLFQRGSTTLKKKWINMMALEARKIVRQSRGLAKNAPLGR